MILHPKLLNRHTLGILEHYVSTNKYPFHFNTRVYSEKLKSKNN